MSSSIVVYNNITIIIGLEPGAIILVVLIFTILLFIPARLCGRLVEGRARMKSLAGLGPTVLHYRSKILF